MIVSPLSPAKQKERHKQWILALAAVNNYQQQTPQPQLVEPFLVFQKLPLGARSRMPQRQTAACFPDDQSHYLQSSLTAAAAVAAGTPGARLVQRQQQEQLDPEANPRGSPPHDSIGHKARPSQLAEPRSKVTLCKKDKNCPTQGFEDTANIMQDTLKYSP